MAPSFSPGPKVTLTGATSKGVFAQGTVHQAKEGGAEVLFVTHFQPSNCFSGAKCAGDCGRNCDSETGNSSACPVDREQGRVWGLNSSRGRLDTAAPCPTIVPWRPADGDPQTTPVSSWNRRTDLASYQGDWWLGFGSRRLVLLCGMAAAGPPSTLLLAIAISGMCSFRNRPSLLTADQALSSQKKYHHYNNDNIISI